MDAAPTSAAIPRDQRALNNEAIAACAQSLLASSGQGRLEKALQALLKATDATYVFVERNVEDPELGFCSATVAEVESEGATTAEADDDVYWDLVPWAKMPTSRSYLERGEPFVLVPTKLTGPEFDLYEADPWPVVSGLNIPIFVNGEWAGLVGFAHATQARDWTPTDLSLLSAAASMIGAFWERANDQTELEQLVKSKDDFIAAISHELRTPLTSVLGLAEELTANLDSYERLEIVELLALVQRESSDMAHLIEDLLVMARIDGGNIPVAIDDVDLREELCAVASQLETEIDVIEGEAVARADDHRVRQILRNLLTNAARYGGDTLRIRIHGAPETASIEVWDDGDGVPAESVSRIFDRYQRGHSRPGLTQSIGLGLSVSRDLAGLMNGDLTYSRDGRWTVFALSLPRAPILPAAAAG